MTDEADKSEKTELPDGTRKVIHTEFDVLKLDTKIKNSEGKPIGKTGKGVKLVFDNGFGAKTVQLPEGKFTGNALKVPRNKQLWADLNQEGLEEDSPVTISMIKEKGYWDIERVQLGHIGTPGLVKIESEQSGTPQATTSGGGGYDQTGAIVGQMMNFAVAMLQSDKTVKAISVSLIEEKTLEIMPEVLASKTKLEASYRLLSKGVAKESAAKESVDDADEDEDNDPVPADDDEDFDDDVPF